MLVKARMDSEMPQLVGPLNFAEWTYSLTGKGI